DQRGVHSTETAIARFINYIFRMNNIHFFFFFSSRRRHTRSVSAFLLNRSSDLYQVGGAQCYNVLPQLDINNTIDHRPEGDEKWFLENEKTVDRKSVV